jgi:hypothetical protein
MILPRHVAYMGEMRHVGKHHGDKTLGAPKHRREEINKMVQAEENLSVISGLNWFKIGTNSGPLRIMY